MALTVEMIVFSIFFPLFLIGFYRLLSFFIDVRKRGRAIDKFPAEPKHWFWGHVDRVPDMNEAFLKYSRDLASKYPRANGWWMMSWFQPALQVHHFETVKAVLKTAAPKPSVAGSYEFIRRWLGDGILISRGQKWIRNRKLLTPAFHFDVLKGYIKVKNSSTDVFLNKLSKYADEGHSCEFFGNISLLTFDIILRCAFSYENDIQEKGENHPFVHATTTLGSLWAKRIMKPWLFLDFVYDMTKDGKEFQKYCDYVHSVAEEVIQKRKQTLEETGPQKERYMDFLDILLMAKDEDGSSLTDREIRDEVDTFLFAGHDTTASSISWTLYSLAEHPQIQRKCQDEIDCILDADCHVGDDIQWEDLGRLHYLTMCIKESMRLHGPVPFIGRQTDSELVIDEVTLPKGSLIDINIYTLHHNPAIWEDPMEFIPERFLPENIAKKDPFAFVPFSAGPRNCIGQHFAMHEQKVVIARILRRFFLELDQNFKAKKTIGLVMKSENGILLKATPRFM